MSVNQIYRIYNRTTHTVSIRATDGRVAVFRSEGIAFRVESQHELLGQIQGKAPNGEVLEFDISVAGFGKTVVVAWNHYERQWQFKDDRIPAISPNIIYIVSSNVKTCNPDRPDFFSPGTGIFGQAHTSSGEERSVKIGAIGFNAVFK